MDEQKLKLALVLLVLSILAARTVAGICGEFPYGNCAQACFGNCTTKISTETDLFKRELIVMDKNICEAKCQGDVYVPHGKSNYEKDFKYCALPCSDPIPPFCRTGYLGLFLYCSCIECCYDHEEYLTIKYDQRLCLDGCHEHYGKIGYPTEKIKPKDVCRYREEFNSTPNAWCFSWCTYQNLMYKGVGTASISLIQSTLVQPCVIRCAAFIANGIAIDFDTVLDESCSQRGEHWRCVTAVSIDRFVITTSITDEQINKAPTPPQIYQHLSPIPSIVNTYVDTQGTTKNIAEVKFKDGEHKFYKFIFSLYFPNWIHSLREIGKVNVTTGNANVEHPSTTSSRIPWAEISTALKHSFGYNTEEQGINQVSAKYHRKHDIKGCTRISTTVFIKMAKVDFDIEFYARVSDSKSLLPLTALELRNAMKEKWSGAEYVKDIGAHAIQVKGKATISGKVARGYFSDVKCENGCQNIPNFDAKTACRCTTNCDDEPVS